MAEQQSQSEPATEQSPDSATETAKETPGHLLKAGRERLQLTTEQVAERLRLRQQIVLDLEQDLFSKYVASTFTRGYLRAYARLVEIDDERVLRAYDALGFDQTPTQTMQSFSRRTRQQTQDSRLMLLTYLIIALIIGSAIIFWLQNRDDTSATSSQPGLTEQLLSSQGDEVSLGTEGDDAPQITSATSDPILIDTSLLEADDDIVTEQDIPVTEIEVVSEEPAETPVDAENDVTDTAETPAEQQSTAQPAREPQQSAQPSESAEAESPALPEGELVLRFAGDTWVRIEDASGEAVAFGVKSGGHETILEGGAPYHLTLGAPENVELYYAGERIDLSDYRAGRVARLTLPQTE